jgi:hypothetical protein
MDDILNNLALQLNAELSLQNTKFTAAFIGNDEEKFAALIKLIETGNNRTAGRAAWVMEKLVADYPYLLTPYIIRLIKILPKAQNDALKRHVLKQLTQYALPDDELGFLYEYCMQLVLSKHERVAGKIHAMQLMYLISEKEPDLKPELMDVILSQYEHGSAGFKNRATKIVRKLEKEI